MRRGVDEENGSVGVATPVLPSSSSSSSATTTARIGRRADPFLVVCGCFSFITALAAILCIAVNVLSAIRSFKNQSTVSIYLLFFLILLFSNLFIHLLDLIYDKLILCFRFSMAYFVVTLFS